MKIGILTLFYDNINWGGVLQGYALKTYLEREFPSSQVDILYYKSSSNIVYPNKFRQALQYSPLEIIKRIFASLKKSNICEIDQKLSNRRKLFKIFTDKYMTNSKIYNDNNLVRAAKEYDCLICGSDQIWNPNVAKPGYFLSMVDMECIKVSYAASIARNSLTKYEQRKMLPLIKKFDFVSVREKTAKMFLELYSENEIGAEEVLDPAFLLNNEKWSELSGVSVSDEGYVLAFFFSESLKYRREIKEYCESRGLTLKFIPFARNNYISTDEVGECERIYDVGPIEFIRLFQQATCVFTDSFHGSVFSIIFNKPFCVFERDKNTKTSKNSRLYDLLNKFSLEDRLVRDEKCLGSVISLKIDYDEVNKKLSTYRNISRNFIEKSLECVNHTDKDINNIYEMDADKCCGCGLCAHVCPCNCISMEYDCEGFARPHVDDKYCVNCKKCISLCPVLKKDHKVEQGRPGDVCYVGYNEVEDIRMKSSSGGLFYEVAKSIINSGGVVYGAAFDENFKVKHIRIDSCDDICLLQTSKYVQSDISDIYKVILSDLVSGKKVLFSGTPCQVAAIYSIAEKNSLTNNLFLVDFVCHGVPSPKVWESYLAYLSGNGNNILNVNFRDKSHRGWHDYCLCIKYRDNSQTVLSHNLDLYMNSFLSDVNMRCSCYDCEYKNDMYISDITMGDAWKIEKFCMDWADDKGTSLFVIHTEKGKKMLKMLSDMFAYRESDYAVWKKFNPSIVCSSNKPVARKRFFSDFCNRDNDHAFWHKQKSCIRKNRCKYIIRRIAKKFGIEKYLRKYV